MPDATVLMKEASRTKIDFRLQINDMLLLEYHPKNGFTKKVLRLPPDLKKKDDKTYAFSEFVGGKEGSWPVSTRSQVNGCY